MRSMGVYQSGILLDTINISPYTQKLQNLYTKEKTTSNWDNIYEGETQKLRFKIIVDSYNLRNPLYTGTDKESNWFSGKVLLKLK